MKKILVGVNFEHESNTAIEDSFIMAVCHDATIIPIHAVESLPRSNQQHEIDLLTKLIDKRFTKAANLLSANEVEVYEPVIEKGDPAVVLQTAAKVLDVDLLVIGAGVNERDHDTLGVTAKAIIKESSIPVLVSNNATEEDRYSEIICAVDLSRGSHKTLDRALGLARQFNSKLHILHVEPDEFYYPGMFNSEVLVSPWIPNQDEIDIKVEETGGVFTENLSAKFQEFLERVDLTGLKSEIHVKVGETSQEIISFVKDNKIGILVIGSLGKSGFIDKFLDSTVEKVLDQLPCSILTVPHKKE